MSDETKRIGARVPVSLLDKLCDAGYDSHTEAILKGLELLITQAKPSLTCETKENNSETTEHKNKIESLGVENRLLTEHIDTLKKELEISQETHRNYMMQMQTLINQKSIEAPGAKKSWWKFWN